MSTMTHYENANFLRELAENLPRLLPQSHTPNQAALLQRLADAELRQARHEEWVRNKVAAARASFRPALPRAGRYEVCLGFRPSKTQATNTPVLIKHAAGTAKLSVDQRNEKTPFLWVPLGEFDFKAGASNLLELRNANTDGRIALDAVRWRWIGAAKT